MKEFLIGEAEQGRAYHPWDGLKKCPMCGNYPWLVGKDGIDYHSGSPYTVICSNKHCHCKSIKSDNISLCKTDWNNK